MRRAGRLRPLAALSCAALLLGLASCQSIPGGGMAASATAEDFHRLDSFELELLDLRLAPDRARLSRVRADLARAAGRPGAGRLYQARAVGLEAEAALLAGDTGSARRYADTAAQLSAAEEEVFLVRAALETDPARRLTMLDAGISKSDRTARLLCERGEALLKAGRYAEAAQDLDEGLRGLDERYRALYGADRDRALGLAQALRDSGSATPPPAQAQSLDAPISMRAMVERAFTGTQLLGAFSAQPAPSYESARPALAAAGLLLQPDAAPSAQCTRKDVAFFLWGIILHAERDPQLAGFYRRKYSTSPVPDVPVDAPWFDAALGLVEREIMDLPDGVHFEPDGAVTGLQYLSMLARLSKLYR